jgi:hypothetical protein
MTSPCFNAEKARAEDEQRIFDGFGPQLREAINNCPIPVRSSVILSALLRGVTEAQIIERLTRSQDG